MGKVMKGLQQGAEGSLHLTLATKGSWEHFENEYAIRKELQKPENHKKAELYHNLGAAISSASMSHHLDAIDAVETSYMLKNTKDSLLLLERLYEKELMYLGKAFTGCRLANYATDLNAAKKLINQNSCIWAKHSQAADSPITPLISTQQKSLLIRLNMITTALTTEMSILSPIQGMYAALLKSTQKNTPQLMNSVAKRSTNSSKSISTQTAQKTVKK